MPAYPRWCGEHWIVVHEVAHALGLPPLVRGARLAMEGPEVLDWPTPAGAGSTISPVTSAGHIAAYPRWCGEHSSSLLPASMWRGLPPLVRGALVLRTPRADGLGPTPAGAGSTQVRGAGLRHVRAYPRWCGEHLLDTLTVAGQRGLPPLVRGARPRH